jgi:hypothetical protein
MPSAPPVSTLPADDGPRRRVKPEAPPTGLVAGRAVRLGGYRTQDPRVLTLAGGAASPVTTPLVVPAATGPDAAEAALADPARTDPPRSLLEPAGPAPALDVRVPA